MNSNHLSVFLRTNFFRTFNSYYEYTIYNLFYYILKNVTGLYMFSNPKRGYIHRYHSIYILYYADIIQMT